MKNTNTTHKNTTLKYMNFGSWLAMSPIKSWNLEYRNGGSHRFKYTIYNNKNIKSHLFLMVPHGRNEKSVQRYADFNQAVIRHTLEKLL